MQLVVAVFDLVSEAHSIYSLLLLPGEQLLLSSEAQFF